MCCNTSTQCCCRNRYLRGDFAMHFLSICPLDWILLIIGFPVSALCCLRVFDVCVNAGARQILSAAAFVSTRFVLFVCLSE